MGSSKVIMDSGTSDMTFVGLGEMFEGDSLQTRVGPLLNETKQQTTFSLI